MKIHRVRLPDLLSKNIEAEAAQRGISVSQLLRERITAASHNDTVSVQLLGNILKESIVSRKYCAYSLAMAVGDKDRFLQKASEFHREAEEMKNLVVNSLDNRS